MKEIGSGDAIVTDGFKSDPDRLSLSGPDVKPEIRNDSEKWAEEYSEFTDDDFSNLEALNQDYWTKLESQWQALAEEEEASWAQEFKDESMLELYDFKQDNPLINHPNALAEGKMKLEKGTLTHGLIQHRISTED